MMRRKPQFTSNQLKIADLILDRDTRKVTRAGNEIDLSAKEFYGSGMSYAQQKYRNDKTAD